MGYILPPISLFVKSIIFVATPFSSWYIDLVETKTKEETGMEKRLSWHIVLFLIIIAMSLALSLYGQTPTPVKPSNEPKSDSKNSSKKTQTIQPNSQNPSSSQILQITPQPKQKAADTTNKQDNQASGNGWIRLFTGVLAFVAIVQLITFWIQTHWMHKTLNATKETTESVKIQAETMQKELVLTQRPKLRIRDVIIPDLRDRFPKNKIPNGEFYIVNVGGTPAKITNVGCWVEWLSGGLPMKKPYDGESPNCPNAVSTKLQAGQGFPLKFIDNRHTWERAWDYIFMGSGDMPLYVMGYVEYIDDIGTPRRTTFCRQYRWPEGEIHELGRERRFFPVDDSDYENEE